MLKYFNCPDGETRLIKDCLEQCPRTEGRCLSLLTLHDFARATKQPLAPTRIEYLKTKYDYAIDPLFQDINRDKPHILDLLEPNDIAKGFRLVYPETFGSFYVAKILSDSKAGLFEAHQLAIKINELRLLAERSNFNITELKCQISVKDGGTQAARNNGISFKLMLIPVPILDNDYVINYCVTKAETLLEAVKKDQLPPMCDWNERWGGRRCKYCDVFMFCPEGAKINKMEVKQ